MKRVLIIDGYNFIQRNRAFNIRSDGNLQSARETLASAMAAFVSRTTRFDEALLVFDGKGSGTSRKKFASTQKVFLIYSPANCPADDTIKSLVKRLCDTCAIVVVSDDNYVSNNARAYGVDIISTADLVKMLKADRRHTAPFKKNTFEKKEISSHDRHAINEALKKYWNIE